MIIAVMMVVKEAAACLDVDHSDGSIIVEGVTSMAKINIFWVEPSYYANFHRFTVKPTEN